MRVAANAHLDDPISKLAVLVSGNPILALNAVGPSTPTVVSVIHFCDEREHPATVTENMIRLEHGIPIRHKY